MNQTQTAYDLLDNPPPFATAVADLWRWAENYDYPTPASLFLDLIGYSDEEYGQPLFDLAKVPERLGYLEIGQLGEALIQYAEMPNEVRAWIDTVMAAEEEETEGKGGTNQVEYSSLAPQRG